MQQPSIIHISLFLLSVLRQRVRIRFTKQDDLRWISHRDLIRVWERLFLRAGVAISMTEGFHPKPRLNFPSALAVGIAGTNEMLEVDLAEPHTAESLRKTISPELPPGMNVGDIEILPAPDRKAQAKFVTFQMEIPPERRERLIAKIAEVMNGASLIIERDGRKAPLDLRPLIGALALADNGSLQIRLIVDREGSARPREVLQALDIADLEYEGYFLTRTQVEVE
jgi:radical SAM-linked protein